MPKSTPTGTSGHKSETKTFTGRPRRRLPLLEDEDEDNTNRSSLDANTTDVSLFDSSNSKKRRKVEKCANDSIPLPNTFSLPKHFRRDVEVALETKQLTKETHSQFFSAVASSMLAYKRYPTAEDYRNVSVSICDKYEYMKSPVGSPYVHNIYIYNVTLITITISGCNYSIPYEPFQGIQKREKTTACETRILK